MNHQISQDVCINNDEWPVFGCAGSPRVSRQASRRSAHRRARFGKDPPLVPVGLALVLVSLWFDAHQQMLVGRLPPERVNSAYSSIPWLQMLTPESCLEVFPCPP